MQNMPVRNINNIRSRKNVGYFPSTKNCRNISFESLLEEDYIYLIEYEKSVLSYLEQPVAIEYYYNSRKYKYTPDFKVNRNSKIQLIEIKPKNILLKLLEKENEKRKFNAAYEYCKRMNFEFKIITDEDIRSGNVLKNIKYLYFYANIKVPSYIKLLINNVLINNSMNIETLDTNLKMLDNTYNNFKPFIYSLIYSHFLSININNPISHSSMISINS